MRASIYQKVFDQYLRTTQIPVLEYYFGDDRKKVFYRYSNCVAGFNLPLVLAVTARRRSVFCRRISGAAVY